VHCATAILMNLMTTPEQAKMIKIKQRRRHKMGRD